MDAPTARPKLLKQANLSAIRRVIRARGSATRAEITRATNISSTTVRALLHELIVSGELVSVGHDESSGGRKAERYSFTPERYYGAALCIVEGEVRGLLVDVYGAVLETTPLNVVQGNYQQAIFDFLDRLVSEKEIKAVGLGVPGVVERGGFWQQIKSSDALCWINLGDEIAKRYDVPIVMENDLNAMAIGFGRCYEREFSRENPEETNMALVYFEDNCVSAGFLAGGRIIRGCRQFAGELGMIPAAGETLLCQTMAEEMDDVLYANRVINILGWICGILNPQYIALGGPALRKDCVGPIGDGLLSLLPKQMFAEILYAPDLWHDYYDGMAYLTAGKMFDEIQFLQE